MTKVEQQADGRWGMSGVSQRELDAGEAGSKEASLGAFDVLVVADVMITIPGTPGTVDYGGVRPVGVRNRL